MLKKYYGAAGASASLAINQNLASLQREWQKSLRYLSWLSSRPGLPAYLHVLRDSACFRINVDAIHNCITSKRFWTMVRVTHQITGEAEHIGNFCEGCHCHEHFLMEWATRKVGLQMNRNFISFSNMTDLTHDWTHDAFTCHSLTGFRKNEQGAQQAEPWWIFRAGRGSELSKSMLQSP